MKGMSMSERFRAFIALEVTNPETVAEIAAYQERIDEAMGSLKRVAPEILHLTLRFLGDITEDQAESIYHFLQILNSEFEATGPKAFTVIGVGTFQHKTFFVSLRDNLDWLRGLVTKIDEFLLQFDYVPEDFRPHITVARSRKNAQMEPDWRRAVAEYKRVAAEFREKVFGTWTVDRILLKKSTLTPEGPIYENLSYED
jgi:2'-5' RNA ligase